MRVLIPALFILAALGSALAGGSSLLEKQRSSDLIKVAVTVTSSSIEEKLSSSHTKAKMRDIAVYAPSLSLAYAHRGTQHVWNLPEGAFESRNRKGLEGFLERYRNPDTAFAFIDPDNPENLRLEKEVTPVYIVFFIISALCGLAGYLLWMDGSKSRSSSLQ